jgi:hypothetical protein
MIHARVPAFVGARNEEREKNRANHFFNTLFSV